MTITLPATDRYMSIFCIDQDQFTVHYDTAPATFSLRRELLKTRDLILVKRHSFYIDAFLIQAVHHN